MLSKCFLEKEAIEEEGGGYSGCNEMAIMSDSGLQVQTLRGFLAEEIVAISTELNMCLLAFWVMWILKHQQNKLSRELESCLFYNDDESKYNIDFDYSDNGDGGGDDDDGDPDFKEGDVF